MSHEYAENPMVWIRQMLSQKPSQSLFSQLYSALERLSDEDQRELAIDYVSQHLESWDDRLRHVHWGRLWSVPFEQTRGSAALVRSVELPTTYKDKAALMTAFSAHLPEVSGLCFRGPWMDHHYNYIKEALSGYVFGHGVRSQLQSLSLFRAPPEEEEAFFEKNHFPALRHLVLDGGIWGLLSPELLTRALPAVRLESLVLVGRRLGAGALKACLEQPPFRGLESLRLSHNPIGQLGVRFVMDSPCCATLKELALVGCELAREPDVPWRPIPHLESLRLDYNELWLDDLESMELASCFPRLRRLSLSCNRLGGFDGHSLGQLMLCLPELERLDLSYNRLSDVDLEALLRAMSHHPRLSLLLLQGNAGRKELCRTFTRFQPPPRSQLLAQLQEPLSRFFRLLLLREDPTL